MIVVAPFAPRPLGLLSPFSRQIILPRTFVGTYASDGDANGIFNFIGTQYGAASFANPQTLAADPLSVLPSGVLASSEEQISTITTRSTGHFYTTNVANSWIKFDLGPRRRLILNAYSYRSRSGFSGDWPTAWKLEGSNDNTTWTLIDSRSVSFSAQNQWLTTAVSGQTVPYQYFKWTLTAVNSASTSYFVMGQAEFYGTLSFL